eukprot:6906020-Prymnesium_polylepis.1
MGAREHACERASVRACEGPGRSEGSGTAAVSAVRLDQPLHAVELALERQLWRQSARLRRGAAEGTARAARL